MDQRINSLSTNQSNTANSGTTNPRQQKVAAQRNPSSNTAAKTVGSSSDYAITRRPASLHVGDTLRGEITDLRNNEISITLEDNTTIRARISDSSSYSIGQMGTFRLSNISGNTLYLENISVGYSDTELFLIKKALQEANLPDTDYNQDTVKALMDNLLPINRESIQHLMQQAHDYSTQDMNTLALMNRLMMKIDADSVEQFSNYRNDNYQLLSQLQSYSEDLPSLLSTLAQNAPSEPVALFGKNMLSIALQPDMTDTQKAPVISQLPSAVYEDILSLLSDTLLSDDTLQRLQDKTLSLHQTLVLLNESAKNKTLAPFDTQNPSELAEQLNHIEQLLNPSVEPSSVITEDYVKNALSIKSEVQQPAPDTEISTPDTPEQKENAPVTEEKANAPHSFAGKLFQSLSEGAKNTLTTTFDALRSSRSSNPPIAYEPNESLSILSDLYEKYAKDQNLLDSYLSASERQELHEEIKKMPVSKSLLDKILSGNASTKEVLTVISNTAALNDTELTKELFQSQVFEKIFARQLQTNWTITPEQLAQGKINDFYKQMHHQLNQFQNLIQSTLSGSDSDQLGNQARNMEENIAFMKTLNDMFSYVQLPLRLPSQETHGDLYVYSKKEQLKQSPDKNSVLLHLNMEHLGMVDIKIDRNKYQLKTDFSLDDAKSAALLKTNTHLLSDALESLGYQCSIHIKEQDTPSPTVDDFINTKVNTRATSEMKRFTFDIRA